MKMLLKDYANSILNEIVLLIKNHFYFNTDKKLGEIAINASFSVTGEKPNWALGAFVNDFIKSIQETLDAQFIASSEKNIASAISI